VASRLTIPLFVAAVAAAFLASSAAAQVHGMRATAPAFRNGGSFRIGGGNIHARLRRPFNRSLLLSSPYFYPDYDYGYDYEPPTPGMAPTPVQVFFTQPTQLPAPVASPIEPLLMEYRDGRWVRVLNDGQRPEFPQSAQPNSGTSSNLRQGIPVPKETAQAPPELPATVLVFRDGRQEEVKKYTIIGSVIYASVDYWTTGSWTTEIPMALLDIPATLKVNAEHDVKFNLPSGPNEIMIHF
jgi:hypothetical protein